MTEPGTSGTPVTDDEGRSGPVVRDRRRLDPTTGQVRAAYAGIDPEPAAAPEGGGGPAGPNGAAGPTGAAAATGAAGANGPVGPGDEATADDLGTEISAEIEADLAAARAEAGERLADLQRLQAEFVNYRRRVERDRDLARDSAIASVLEALLPVLDDVHLARRHGDLTDGPFAAIADKLEATLGRYGLARYGEPGEAFDPTVHEALIHTEAELAEGTETTTVVQVLQPGYRAGDRVLRPARVAVADPR